nr:hypothetical protein [Maliibacterium massiliense]
MTETDIRTAISTAYQNVFHRALPDDDVNFLSPHVGNRTVDYLYFLQELEQALGVSVTNVLARNDYTVFTVRNLAQALYRQYNHP